MKRLDRQDLLVQRLNVAHHDATHRVILLWAHLGMVREMDVNRVTCDDGKPGLPVTDLKSKEGEKGQGTVGVIDGHNGNGPQKGRWMLGWSLRTHMLLSFRLDARRGFPHWFCLLIILPPRRWPLTQRCVQQRGGDFQKDLGEKTP